MIRFRLSPRAALLVLAVVGLASPGRAQTSPDSLVLLPATDVQARGVYRNAQKRFQVWISWREAGDAATTAIAAPNLTTWVQGAPPPAPVSIPAVTGAYSGDIDRTLVFRVTRPGGIGVDSVIVGYNIQQEERLAGTLTLNASYAPNTALPLPFRDQLTGEIVDFGMTVAFSPGPVDTQGVFTVGVQDFEGFHIWRGVEPDGSDLEIIGELSKEEAHRGSQAGGSEQDSVYFTSVLPTLRQGVTWFSPVGPIECLGTRIEFPLDADQLFWYDCNAVNGFTYYYAVTTYDRGYNPASSSQGLTKVDNCPVPPDSLDKDGKLKPTPYPCADQLLPLKVEVDPLVVKRDSDLLKVYVVPNPYRSGSSRLTTDNYHNFPDRFIRFVNVPADCTIHIYTVAGDLVWEYAQNSGAGDVEWDATNRDAQPVASGVYVYRLETSEGGAVYGRIAVIR